MKNIIYLLFLLIICFSASAQSQQAKNMYLEFDLLRLGASAEQIINAGEKLLPLADSLPSKTRTNFYNKLAVAYERSGASDQAATFYEKVVAAEPDYYVAHMALGNLLAKQANLLVPKINASKTDKAKYEPLKASYLKLIEKALVHLEKAYSCDPNDPMKGQLLNLYKAAGNDEKQLESRLSKLSGLCVELLTDED